tara:strand:+ start:247 stop:621 length:375 start_codon:yes stop_codon:yes gene_type:complete
MKKPRNFPPEDVLADANTRCPFCQQDNRCLSAQVKNAQVKSVLVEGVSSKARSAGVSINQLSPERNASLSPAQPVSCWCFVQQVPQALIDLVPSSSQHKHCICQRCVNEFESEPVAFQRRYCSY